MVSRERAAKGAERVADHTDERDAVRDVVVRAGLAQFKRGDMDNVTAGVTILAIWMVTILPLAIVMGRAIARADAEANNELR